MPQGPNALVSYIGTTNDPVHISGRISMWLVVQRWALYFSIFFGKKAENHKKNRKTQSPSLYNEPHRNPAGGLHSITSPTNVLDQSFCSPCHPELENVFKKVPFFVYLMQSKYLFGRGCDNLESYFPKIKR